VTTLLVNEYHGVATKKTEKSVLFGADTGKAVCINGLENWLILIFNHGVEGSSPSALTNNVKYLVEI
jgi:hypothetical protein